MCLLNAQLIFRFIIAYAKNRFPRDKAYLLGTSSILWDSYVIHN